MSNRELSQRPAKARKAAKDGPVFIMHRGRVAHVLISVEEYQRLSGKPVSILDLLAMPELDQVEFDPPCLDDSGFKPAEFDGIQFLGHPLAS